MRKVTITIIPQAMHRYSTVGDWYYDPKGDIQINVSDMGDERASMLVAIHELVEIMLCRHAVPVITQLEVDEFDEHYEEERAKGNPLFQDEPGDHVNAPYQQQHNFATSVERMVCAAMGIKWMDYEQQLTKVLK